ncbi:MAG TPA: SRPBCC family protein [Acidimicrobiales bacterium]|nr:SRPBCC family protein [Acidimicrobiales bacterium]
MEWTGARYADRPTVEVGTVIAAPPDEVWPVVSDPLAMPEWSDELQSVVWLDGAESAAVGRRFEGHNANEPMGEWTTVSTIVECEAGRRFAWAVGDPSEPAAVWRFTLTPDAGGTRLTQWVQVGPGWSGLSIAIEAMPDKEQKIVFVRLRQHEASMTRTLAGIRDRVESRR